MKIIFLSGIITNLQREFINKNSIGRIQYAADSLQHGFINGLSKCMAENMLVLNLPFVGSYPKKFKRVYFQNSNDTINKSEIKTIGFLNLLIIKHFSRTLLALKGLLKYTPRNSWIVVYSTHPPFLISSIACKFIRKDVRLCLIVPDLPDHMGAKFGLQGLINKVFINLFYRIIKHFDCYALLTEQMIERLGVEKSKCVIIEGISAKAFEKIEDYNISNNSKSLLYTGSLDERYGIKNLVNAFTELEDKNINLWICGEGDSRIFVETKAKIDNRIKYFGQVDRLESIKLQHRATVLINPRLPGDEYTKYSFPSKIMEYMSTGRPVIMYRLPGIPNDYFEHCFVPADFTTEGLKNCITTVLKMDDLQLNLIGKSARNYVLSNKNPVTQANKLINLLSN